MSPTNVDLLIIGGGPAGLSAAITFSRLRRSCIVYDSGVYRNGMSAHAHTILGFEGQSPASYRDKVRADLLEWYGDLTKYKEGKIVYVKKTGDVFEVKDAEGNELIARKIVLATGLKDYLPDIPGLAETWGKRAIHCIFCHGTETANKPFAFLYTKANARMNPGLAGTMLKLWPGLNHTESYILTHGLDVETPEGRRDAGLEAVWDAVQKKGYKIITSPITSVEETADKSTLNINFASHPPIMVPNMLVFPERVTPNEDALPFVNEELFGAPLGMWGATPPAPTPAAMMPRMGEDPTTPVKGLFWAGNAGSGVANVTASVAQGQIAGAFAGDELGAEDLAKL
ncbi:hypothetical protein IAT38_007595 [Cryptococcus sp. DSM 104549]